MRIGVLSDIHGNLEALDKALEVLEEERVERLICAGDVVGYGPEPSACISRLQEKGVQVVKGNHDAVASGEQSENTFNSAAKEAILWTRSQLSEAERNWLKALPYLFHGKGHLLVHASPIHPEEWEYLHHPYQAVYHFEGFQEPVGFLGHTHVPMIFQLLPQSVRSVPVDYVSPLKLDVQSRYLINVGSVGQPRDGNPLGCVCVYDTDRAEIRHLRFAYDIPSVQEKMSREGLPRRLRDRLALGE